MTPRGFELLTSVQRQHVSVQRFLEYAKPLQISEFLERVEPRGFEPLTSRAKAAASRSIIIVRRSAGQGTTEIRAFGVRAPRGPEAG